MRKFFVIILLLFWPTFVFAETLWVRPPSQGEYGLEDGSDYDNAFDGWTDIVWGVGAGKLGPGDTLKFCGTWYYDADFGYLGEADHLIMQAGGTDSENQITIDFGDATYPGTIVGSLYVEGAACSDDGDGLFTFNSGYGSAPSFIAYGDDYTTAVPMYKSDSSPPADGYYYYDSGTEDITINPPGVVAYVDLERSWYQWRGSFSVNGYDYITLNEPKIYFMSDSYPAIELSDYTVSGRSPDNIIITGGTFRYTGGEFINCRRSSSSYITLSYNNYKYFQQVYYPNYSYNSIVQNHTYWHCHHEYVDGDTQYLRTTLADAHLLGGQNISYSIFEYNTIVGAEGDCFLNYVGGGSTSFGKYNTYRYNFMIYDPDADSLGLYGRAFDVGSTLADDADERTKENYIYENIVIGALIGFRTKSGYDPTSGTYNKVHNNTFINCVRVVELISPNHGEITSCGNGVDFRNNLVLGSENEHFYSDNHDDSYFSVVSDYNLFYPDGASKFYYDGVASDDFADWQLDTSLDSNSVSSDPLLAGAGTYDETVDAKTLVNSPARNGGTDLGLVRDFFNNLIQGPYDIGAFQYNSSSFTINSLIIGGHTIVR